MVRQQHTRLINVNMPQAAKDTDKFISTHSYCHMDHLFNLCSLCVSVVGMTEFAQNSSTILQIKSKKSTPLSLPELFSFMPYGPDSSLSHVKVSWATPSSPITAEVALKHAWSERAYTKYAYEFCTRVIEQEGKSNP